MYFLESSTYVQRITCWNGRFRYICAVWQYIKISWIHAKNDEEKFWKNYKHFLILKAIEFGKLMETQNWVNCNRNVNFCCTQLK